MKGLVLTLVLFGLSLHTAAQLNGSYTVGSASTDDFTCLTCPGGAFRTLNSAGISGSVTFYIRTDLLQETGEYNLEAFPAPYKVYIRPAAAKVVYIRQTMARELIDLKGADRVTIDGSFQGSGEHLYFESPFNYPVIQYKEDCEDNVLRHCVIHSDNGQTSSTRGGAILVKDDVDGSDRLEIEYNRIEPYQSSDGLKLGIRVAAPSTGNNVGLRIYHNEFNSIQYRGIYLSDASGAINGAAIGHNHFIAYNRVAGDTSGGTVSMVYVNSGTGHRLVANRISGNAVHMSFALNAATSRLYLFRLGSAIQGSQLIEMDSNIVQTVHIQGSAARAMDVSIFRTDPGFDNPLTLRGNFIGHNTYAAAPPNLPNVIVNERFNSADNRFHVFDIQSTSTVEASFNRIGGLLFDHKTALGTKVKLIEFQDCQQVMFEDNLLGEDRDNIVKESDGDLYLLQADCPIVVDNNHLNGITCKDSFASNFKGLYFWAKSGSIRILSTEIGEGNEKIDTASIEINNASPSQITSAKLIEVAGTSVDSLFFTNVTMGSFHCQAPDSLTEITMYGIHVHVEEIKKDLTLSRTYFRGRGNAMKQSTTGRFRGISVTDLNAPHSDIEHNSIVSITCNNLYHQNFIGLEVSGAKGAQQHLHVFGNSVSGINLTNRSYTKAPVSRGIFLHGESSYANVGGNQVVNLNTFAPDSSEIPFSAFYLTGTQDTLRVNGNHVGANGSTESVRLQATHSSHTLFYIRPDSGLRVGEILNSRFDNIHYDLSRDAEITLFKIGPLSHSGMIKISNTWYDQINAIATNGDVRWTGMSIQVDSIEVIKNYINELNFRALSPNQHRITSLEIDVDQGSQRVHGNGIASNIIRGSSSQGNLPKLSFRAIHYMGGQSTVEFNDNRILNNSFTFIDSTNSSIRGIHMSSVQTGLASNNVIMLVSAYTSSAAIYGLHDQLKTGKMQWFHNTVVIYAGQPSVSRAEPSACFYGQNDGHRELLNNLFANYCRGGAEGNYALYFANAAPVISDHNLLHVRNDPGQLVWYNADRDIYSWRNKGFGLFSLAPPFQIFVDGISGKPVTQLGVDKGNASAGVLEDADQNARPHGPHPDMGAYETLDTTGMDPGITSVTDLRMPKEEAFFYPNPSQGQVYFQEVLDIEVLDLSGKTLRKEFEVSSVDLSDLPAGVYLLSDGINVQRLVIAGAGR